MSTLPQIALDKLPLSAEPMSQWKDGTDIRAFAEALYPSKQSSYGLELCSEMEKPLREYARSFTKNLMEAHQSLAYRDFYQDALFGRVMVAHFVKTKKPTKLRATFLLFRSYSFCFCPAVPV